MPCKDLTGFCMPLQENAEGSSEGSGVLVGEEELPDTECVAGIFASHNNSMHMHAWAFPLVWDAGACHAGCSPRGSHAPMCLRRCHICMDAEVEVQSDSCAHRMCIPCAKAVCRWGAVFASVRLAGWDICHEAVLSRSLLPMLCVCALS